MKNTISKNLSHLLSAKAQGAIFIAAALLLMMIGCSSKQQVLVAPKVDLRAYRTIGIIEFSSNAEQEVNKYLTQKYMQTVQSAQPGVRFLELGSAERVLKSMQHDQLDYLTIKTIAKMHNVEAIMSGHLKISKIMPKVHWSSGFKSIKARADVEALLSTRLWETESGATVWTNSSFAKDSVANVSVHGKSPIKFGVSDPKDKYGKLVPVLVHNNTIDFRSRYEYR